MEQNFDRIYLSLSNFFLPGFVAVSLSFASIGLKELKNRGFEGLVYILLSLFFIAVHFYFLLNQSFGLPFSSGLINVNAYSWLKLCLAPVTVLVFILLGLYNIIKTSFKNGLIKIYFGLTLYCYLYMLGAGWPDGIKCSLTLFWLIVMFYLEMKPVAESQAHLRA